MTYFIRVTPELSEAIQKMAFNAGYVWLTSGTNILTQAYPVLILSKKMLTYASDNKYTGVEFCQQAGYTELKTMKEIIEFFKSVVKIPIGDYYGEISKDGKSVKVECQNIPFSEVETLYDKMREIQNENKV